MSSIVDRVRLCQLVVEAGCIKTTELIVKYVNEHYNRHSTVPTDDLVVVVDELVARGELVEVEYVRSDMPYRIKSLLFPKGTEIKVRDVKSLLGGVTGTLPIENDS